MRFLGQEPNCSLGDQNSRLGVRICILLRSGRQRPRPQARGAARSARRVSKLALSGRNPTFDASAPCMKDGVIPHPLSLWGEMRVMGAGREKAEILFSQPAGARSPVGRYRAGLPHRCRNWRAPAACQRRSAVATAQVTLWGCKVRNGRLVSQYHLAARNCSQRTRDAYRAQQHQDHQQDRTDPLAGYNRGWRQPRASGRVGGGAALL